MRYVLGAASMIFVVCFTIAILGNSPRALLEFVDMPSLLPLIMIVSATIFMTGEYRTHTRAVNAILSKKYKISNQDKEKAIMLYKLLAKVVVYTSLLITIIGFVQMIGMMDGELWAASWRAMLSVAVVPLVYGAIINLAFIYPAIHILHNRENSEVAAVISEKLVVDKMLELCYKKGITPEEILDADDISFGGRN